MKTAKDVLKSIKDNDVKYVDLRFTDPRGKWQHVTFDGGMIEEDTFAEGFMSDSLIAFQPAIDEPSDIKTPANVSSSILPPSNVPCCHLPRGSVKRRSTYFTSLSLMDFRTSLAVFMNTPLAYRSS